MRKPENGVDPGSLSRRLLGLICVLNLLGLLYAGLKPFHSPLNDVAWLAHGKGLRFGEFGVIFSSRPIPVSRSNGRSLEIWLQPAQAKDNSTILGFYEPGGLRKLSFLQSGSDLKLQVASSSAWIQQKADSLYVDDVFRERKNFLWTLTSGPAGTLIYRDGVLVKGRSDWRISDQEFSGTLIVGTSPIFNDNWSGTLRGVAIYDRALNEAQILRHYRGWTTSAGAEIRPADSCVALYLLDDRSGGVVGERTGLSSHLVIPPRYTILNQTVLDPVWRAFNWSRGFWKDLIINVAGFIPPSFFLCAYLSLMKLRRPVLLTWLLGIVVSVSIELIQSHLPTRDSSMADLINNAIGCAIGAYLCRGVFARMLNSSALTRNDPAVIG